MSEHQSIGSEPPRTNATPSRADVVICGGGLAGLLLARQLRRELPELTVVVLERTRRPLPVACHKVGESSVELASQYLERLGLGPYLLERQIVKLGLRFFPGGGELPLEERTEIGPSANPIVRSYQLDRGRLEEDLRAMVERDGAVLVEGARVSAVEFGADDADHAIDFELDGRALRIAAHWIVDATGRNALLRKKLRSTRGSQHSASAGWYRVEGRVDMNELVPAEARAWHERPLASERWRSTNHFMGAGYWLWLIPLSTGYTSVGLVLHQDVHSHRHIASLEHVRAFIAEHEPHVARLLERFEPRDFLCLRNYSHSVGRAWSGERWAMVGEAGAFVDPLYSPGSDFIALANCFTVELIKTERAGGELASKATQLNHHYRALFSGAVSLFRNASSVYGHPSAMAAKVFWDNFSYWSFTCHFFQQDLCRLSNDEYAPIGEYGRRFLSLGDSMQRFLRAWAELAPEPQRARFVGAPHFPSILVDAHMQVAQKMELDALDGYLGARLEQAREIAGELVLRVVQQLGPELASVALERADFRSWPVEIQPERLELEALDPRVRRTKLSPIARDVERTLGHVARHAHAQAARELLLGRSAAS